MTSNRRGWSQKSVADRSSPASRRNGQHLLRRRQPVNIVDVANLVLDKGLVVDSVMRGSALGVEMGTVDSRTVIANFDSYLRLAEATNRLILKLVADSNPRAKSPDLPRSADHR